MPHPFGKELEDHLRSTITTHTGQIPWGYLNSDKINSEVKQKVSTPLLATKFFHPLPSTNLVPRL